MPTRPEVFDVVADDIDVVDVVCVVVDVIDIVIVNVVVDFQIFSSQVVFRTLQKVICYSCPLLWSKIVFSPAGIPGRSNGQLNELVYCLTF